jgi:hypothetical protein
MASKLSNGIHYLLTQDPGVSALIGTKVHPGKMPKPNSFPACIYSVNSNPMSTKDKTSESEATVGLDIYAKEYDLCYQIGAAISAVLDRYDNTANGETMEIYFTNQSDGVWNDDVRQFHLQQNYKVWHRSA